MRVFNLWGLHHWKDRREDKETYWQIALWSLGRSWNLSLELTQRFKMLKLLGKNKGMWLMLSGTFTDVTFPTLNVFCPPVPTFSHSVHFCPFLSQFKLHTTHDTRHLIFRNWWTGVFKWALRDIQTRRITAELFIKEKVENHLNAHHRRLLKQIMEQSYKGMKSKQLKMWLGNYKYTI